MLPASSSDGWALYEKLGKPRFVCAPMVDQSELPFRKLCRKYAVDLCYTPMINANQVTTHDLFIHRIFHTDNSDTPVIAQFCGNDPQILLKAAQMIENKVDAVDINFGCPQTIARRGYYGAFLLDNAKLMCDLVRTLRTNLSIPVCAKIRVLPSPNDTFAIVKALHNAGISMLCIHGRTKEQNKQLTQNCDWDIIRTIKQMLGDIPVLANGGCETLADVERCLKHTGCDGYMAAESLLANPAMFLPPEKQPNPIAIAADYIQMCNSCDYDVDIKKIRAHFFKMLYRELAIFRRYRQMLGELGRPFMQQLPQLLQKAVAAMGESNYRQLYALTFSWYHRYYKTNEDQDAQKEQLTAVMDKIGDRIDDSAFVASIISKHLNSGDERKSDDDSEQLSDSSGMDAVDKALVFSREADITNAIFGNTTDSESESESEVE